MKSIPYAVLITLLITLLSGCAREPEGMPVSTPIEMLRFKLPQGNSNADGKILEIAEKFDCHLIYKDFDGTDIAKSWLALPSGKVYLTTPTGDAGAQEMLSLFEDKVLSVLSDKLAKKALPLYVYLCDELSSARQVVDKDGSLALEDIRDIPYILSGQDFWALKRSPSERKNAAALLVYGYTLRYALFQKLENAGLISIPAEFKALSDYSTPTKSRPESDPNYYKNRGFIDIVRDSFSGSPQRFMLYLALRGRNADFIIFVKALIYYTPSEFEQLYPKEKYPLIHRKMDFVKQTLLSQGLDLGRKEPIAQSDR